MCVWFYYHMCMTVDEFFRGLKAEASCCNFFPQVSANDSAVNDYIFFWHRVHVAILSTYLCWRDFFYSFIHFRDWIPFICAECGHSSICSCTFYSYHLYTSLRFYLDKLSTLNKDVRKKLQWITRIWAHSFQLRSGSFVELSINTFRKNCNL